MLTECGGHRGGPHRGAHGGAAPAHGLGEVVGRRAGLAGHAGRGQGAGPVHRRERDPRRLLLAGRRRGRLAARRHADARARAGGRARSPSSANTEVLGIDVERGARPARAHHARRRRDRGRRDLLRRLEPAPRAHGRRLDPAHAGGPPDDRHRPGAALRRTRRARSSSRSCATWTRTCTSARTAAASRSAPTPTARSCTTPTRSPRSRRRRSRPPSSRSRRTTSSQQMEHALELMPEIVGDESVGIKYAINGLLSLTPDGLPILGETPEVEGLWSAAAVWVKEGPGVGRALAEWMVEGEPEIDLQASDVARFYEHQKSVAHVQGARRRGLQQDLRDRPPGRAVGVEPRRAAVALLRARARARRRLLRGRRLGAPALVRVERGRCWRSTATGRGPRGRVGLALVVADHQRRAPRDARPRGDVRPHRLLRLRRRRPGRARGACSACRCARWT